MENVILLSPEEVVRLDADRLCALYQQLGEAGAEDVVFRAIQELAVRLGQCQRQWQARDTSGLRKCSRSLAAISEQVGMVLLARVSGDVVTAIDAGDRTAQAATLARLIRIGERSLTAVWDLQDMSV